MLSLPKDSRVACGRIARDTRVYPQKGGARCAGGPQPAGVGTASTGELTRSASQLTVGVEGWKAGDRRAGGEFI